MIYLNDQIESFDLSTAMDKLSSQRKEEVLRFKHVLGQKLCASAYLLLMEGLRLEYGITEAPHLSKDTGGKPFLTDYPHIHFNFSHCREAVVCALSSFPVGIDIETIRSYNESLVNYTMNDKERIMITQSPRPDVEFIRLWTMKEAKLKWTGHGISNNMKNILEGDEVFFTTINTEKNYIMTMITGEI